MNNNFAYIKFIIIPRGDYITEASFNFIPKMSNTSINNYNIYFTSKVLLSDSLLVKADLTNDPQKIFTSATDFSKLMFYIVPRAVRKQENKDLSEDNIILENIRYLTNVYFPREGKFYPERSIRSDQILNINKVYDIHKATFNKEYEKITTKKDNRLIYKVVIDLSLVNANKKSTWIQYYKLDCNDKAKEIAESAKILYDISLNIYKKPEPIKEKNILTDTLYSGDEDKELPLINWKLKQPRELEKKLKENLKDIAKKYGVKIKEGETFNIIALNIEKKVQASRLSSEEKKIINYFLTTYGSKNKKTRKNIQNELVSIAEKYKIKRNDGETYKITAEKLKNHREFKIGHFTPREKMIINYFSSANTKKNRYTRKNLIDLAKQARILVYNKDSNIKIALKLNEKDRKNEWSFDNNEKELIKHFLKKESETDKINRIKENLRSIVKKYKLEPKAGATEKEIAKRAKLAIRWETFTPDEKKTINYFINNSKPAPKGGRKTRRRRKYKKRKRTRRCK